MASIHRLSRRITACLLVSLVDVHALRLAPACDAASYGQNGHWVKRRLKSHFVDSNCGELPEFTRETMCQQSLKCSSMLLVGDSTMEQKFSLLAKHLKAGQNRSLHRSGLDSDVGFGYSPEDTPLENFYMNCSAESAAHGGRRTQTICQDLCPTEVRLTFVRHDHLNGLKYGGDMKSQCDSWRDELPKHTHLLLSTGNHVGDHPRLMNNDKNVWESRASDLFAFLRSAHPDNVIWWTPYFGVSDHSNRCPQESLWREQPLSSEEINGTLFGGSWRKIPEMSLVYKNAIQKLLPSALVLDQQAILSRRSDCRLDFLHLGARPASPIWTLLAQLQFFMAHA